jgi:serine/threonine protein phosphatase PrpC
MDAINAVMHPIQHRYLYFVATGSGGHQFSQTLAEHNLAVMMQRYHQQGFFNFMLIKNFLLKCLGANRTLLQENT